MRALIMAFRIMAMRVSALFAMAVRWRFEAFVNGFHKGIAANERVLIYIPFRRRFHRLNLRQ